MEEQPVHWQVGAFAMLDVLGWKGIWERRKPQEVIQSLKKVEQAVTQVLSKLNTDHTIVGHTKFGSLKKRVFTISDTIILHAEGDATKTMELIGGCCATVIAHALIEGFYVRGALGYGRYVVSEHSFVGPIVDEVASWYEGTDIVGACLTPQGKRTIDEAPERPTDVFVERIVPVKGATTMPILCVNWPKIMAQHIAPVEVMGYYDAARKDLVITPDVQVKLHWGEMFIKDVLRMH